MRSLSESLESYVGRMCKYNEKGKFYLAVYRTSWKLSYTYQEITVQNEN